MKPLCIAAFEYRFPRAASCVAALAIFAFAGSSCAAQSDPAYTIHVYSNLVQMPVLILGPQLDHVPKVDVSKLTIAVDNGTPFRPTNVRPEGEDPIDLAILLDIGDGNNDLLPVFAAALGKAASRSLRPHDNVAVYALNCNLVPVSPFAPPDPDRLKTTASQAVEATKHRNNCAHPVHMRDALGHIITDLSAQRGRRVILAVSDGKDSGSELSADRLRELTSHGGIAIFALSPSHAIDEIQTSTFGGVSNRRPPVSLSANTHTQDELDPVFDATCKNSGGLDLSTRPDMINTTLQGVIKTVRDRYIVEFPWPKSLPGGDHTLALEIAGSKVYMRSAGIGFSIAATDYMADPTAIQEGAPAPASPAPEASTAPH